MFRILAKGRWKRFHFNLNLGRDKKSLPPSSRRVRIVAARFFHE